MSWFNKKSLPIPEELLRNTVTAKMRISTFKNGFELQLSYDDYLYSSLKEELKALTNVLEEHKHKNVQVTVYLGEEKTTLLLNTKDNMVEATVDLVEVIKARIPSAKNLNVSINNISFGMNDSLLAVKAVALVGNVLKEHFSDDIEPPIKITVAINNSVSLSYIFKWIKQETMNETVVNSNRYLQMVNFLLENPHPQVEKFLFSYRDASKGMFPEMNLSFTSTLTSEEEFETSEFIRSKLNEKFSHLAIY